MVAKATTVALVRKDNGTTHEFEISHAERILRMPHNGGWELPENSQFNFDFENGFTNKRNKKSDNQDKKESND